MKNSDPKVKSVFLFEIKVEIEFVILTISFPLQREELHKNDIHVR